MSRRLILPKADEDNLRRAYRHFWRMQNALNRVKVLNSPEAIASRGVSFYAILHDNSPADLTEDAFIEMIKEDLVERDELDGGVRR